MPMIEITASDLKASTIVTPGWYRILVTKVGETKVSTSGKSNVTFPEGVILRNADDGSKAFEGVPTPNSWNFNDSARGKQDIIAFMTAVSGAPITEPQRIDLSFAEGKEVEAFIGNDMFDNKITNKLTGQFRPAK